MPQIIREHRHKNSAHHRALVFTGMRNMLGSWPMIRNTVMDMVQVDPPLNPLFYNILQRSDCNIALGSHMITPDNPNNDKRKVTCWWTFIFVLRFLLKLHYASCTFIAEMSISNVIILQLDLNHYQSTFHFRPVQVMCHYSRNVCALTSKRLCWSGSCVPIEILNLLWPPLYRRNKMIRKCVVQGTYVYEKSLNPT